MDEKDIIEEFMLLTAAIIQAESEFRTNPREEVLLDLNYLASILARELRTEPASKVSIGHSDRYADVAALVSMDKEERENLLALMNAAINRTKGSIDPWEIKHAFRRMDPCISSIISSSVPGWARGRSKEKTSLPFTDCYGRNIWFDIYSGTRQISVVRNSSRQTPILRIPFSDHYLENRREIRIDRFKRIREYDLPEGSIWILSNLLSPWAPEGAYSGLRIKRGILRIDYPFPEIITKDQLVVSDRALITLELTLHPPDPVKAEGGPGVDARNSWCKLPERVVINFSPKHGGKLTDASDASICVCKNQINLSFSEMDLDQPSPRYLKEFSKLLDRIILPLKLEDPRVIESLEQLHDIPDTKLLNSDLFQADGFGSAFFGAWTLPIAICSPESLGEAEGAGGIAIALRKGPTAGWRGLQGGPIHLGETLIYAEPGRIELFSDDAKASWARHELELWKGNSDNSPPSKIDLHFGKPFRLHYISEAAGIESLRVTALMDLIIDKPIRADGSRIPFYAVSADVLFWHDEKGFRFKLDSEPEEVGSYSLALKNAFLDVAHVLSLRIQGSMAIPMQIESGNLLIIHSLDKIAPMLGDPYVIRSTQDTKSSGEDRTSVSVDGYLLSSIAWKDPLQCTISLQLAAKYESNSSRLVAGNLDTAIPNPEVHPTSIFDPRINPDYIFGQMDVFLLDVSGNMGQVGVALNLISGKTDAGKNRPFLWDLSIMKIQGMDLVIPERNMSVFMLPQVQWEPVIIGMNLARVGFEDDGIPALINGNSVTLVPVSPDQLAEQIVYEFNQEGKPADGIFTLPFGMCAQAEFLQEGKYSKASLDLIRVNTLDPVFRWNEIPGNDNQKLINFLAKKFGINWIKNAKIEKIDNDRAIKASAEKESLLLKLDDYNTEVFLEINDVRMDKFIAKMENDALNVYTPSFTGSLQISAKTAALSSDPDVESPSFTGQTYQKSNLVMNGTQLGMSVLGGLANTFNETMSVKVPVTRIDFSGYGESMFSSWFNPKADLSISQVCFKVMVGRTAFEVVQQASILYPWAAPVLRTAIMQRANNGQVILKNSGWVAVGPGRYRYPSREECPPIITHPGLVKGVYNVRNIKETGNVWENEGKTILMAEVRFDGDFEIDTGEDQYKRITGCGHIGYVQLLPIDYPLFPENLAEMLKKSGPIGGPLDCVVDIGKSGQRMHVVRVDVDTAPLLAGHPHFAVAVRGSLELPGQGSWSVMLYKNQAFQQVRQDTGVPLICGAEMINGDQGSMKGDCPYLEYLIAEPEDLYSFGTTDTFFSLIQSSEAHRMILSCPRIKDKQILSDKNPILADIFSMAAAIDTFPKIDECFEGKEPYKINIGPEGYNLEQINFADRQRQLLFSLGGILDINVDYENNVAYNLGESWSLDIPASIAVSIGSFADLIKIQHNLHVGLAAPAELLEPKISYSDALNTIKNIIKILSELGLPIKETIKVICSAGSYNLLCALDYPIEDPNDLNGYINLSGLRIKGRLMLGFGNHPVWNGYLGINLGMEVMVLPAIYGMGEAGVLLKASQDKPIETEIQLAWGADIPINLVVIRVQGSIYYRLKVAFSDPKNIKIGLLLGISGVVDLSIVTISARLEIVAEVCVVDEKTMAQGGARFAAEIEVSWFLTLDIDYEVSYKEEIGI